MDLIAVLVVIVAIFAAYILGVGWQFRRLTRRWNDWSWGGRLFGVALALMFVASPYLAFRAFEIGFVMTRVPEPLSAIWIEYRHEESRGIGLPGDNETGFVVYRLSRGSSGWARKMGPHLGIQLPGAGWKATPIVADLPQWQSRQSDGTPQSADFDNYLNRYGFSIPVGRDRIEEANRAIRRPGSFYSYGRGGSITVVDPQRGKVYFAYAG